jgi:hypothetical protein
MALCCGVLTTSALYLTTVEQYLEASRLNTVLKTAMPALI